MISISILEIIKAISSRNQELINITKKHILKRVIYVLIAILIPFLIKFSLNYISSNRVRNEEEYYEDEQEDFLGCWNFINVH